MTLPAVTTRAAPSHSRSPRPPIARVRVAALAADIAGILLGGWIAFALRFASSPLDESLHLAWPTIRGDVHAILPQYAGFLMLHLTLVTLILASEGLYRSGACPHRQGEARVVVRGTTIAIVLLMTFAYLARVPVSRAVMLTAWALNVAALVGWRYVLDRLIDLGLLSISPARHVLIVGAGQVGRHLARALESSRPFGLSCVGFLDEGNGGDRILGRITDLSHVILKQFVDEVIITMPLERGLARQVAVTALEHKLTVRIAPEMPDSDFSLGHPTLELWDGLPVLTLHQQPIPELGLLVKRAMDIIGAIVGLALGLPLMLGAAIAIKMYDCGPVLYRSTRLGKKGKPFTCYKLRTMVTDAETLKGDLLHQNERKGPMFKISDDPRVTRPGRFLRKYNIDEWPQFFNVLKGDMSLVGPRPPLPEEVSSYENLSLTYFRRLDVKPGMTSLWAITSQRDPSFDRAVDLDLHYIENWGLWLDVKVILKTIPTVLRGLGR